MTNAITSQPQVEETQARETRWSRRSVLTRNATGRPLSPQLCFYHRFPALKCCPQAGPGVRKKEKAF